MVILSVDLKMPLVDTGSHDGEIIDPKHLKCLIPVRKRFLQPDVEFASVRLFAHAEDVSAEIDNGALHTGLQELFLDPVGDIALRDGTQVDGGIRGEECQRISGEDEVVVIHLRNICFDVCFIRDHGLAACEIPEGTQRLDRNVKGTVRFLAVFQTFCQKRCHVVGDRDSVGGPMVDLVELAGL